MNKTILITGGSRGIGRATALQAGALGWSVGVGFGENRSAADSAVAAVQESGGGAVAVQGDVAVETDVLGMFDATEAALGPLDGVVVNAGIVAPSVPVADMTEDRLRRMFDVNVLGAFLCSREAARRLSRSRGGNGGAIVLVSSVAARLGAPNEYVDYAASKAALDTLCVGLAKELAGDGVRVNAVRPGIVATELHAIGGQPDRVDRLGKDVPVGRAGRPGEIAEAIVWLLSDAASYTTGALLDVAGGR